MICFLMFWCVNYIFEMIVIVINNVNIIYNGNFCLGKIVVILKVNVKIKNNIVLDIINVIIIIFLFNIEFVNLCLLVFLWLVFLWVVFLCNLYYFNI